MRTRDKRLLVAAASLLLLAAMGWRGFSGYRHLTQPPPDLPASPMAANRPSPAGPERRLADVATWHLFGNPTRRAAPPPEPQPVDAPATRLDLKLLGVLASDDRLDARAIIGAPGVPDRQYRLGDTVPAGAELAAIHRDHVLLKRNGRFETLALAREDGAAADTSTRRAAPPGRPAGARALPDD
ncbi:MAG: type II secretion system protein N [Gammaproteobacteria bacterium]|nr:type II secretion system protein N [Gammaproteobacteria bacterium]